MAKDPLDIALHFLKFRPRTEFEVRQKLKLKKIDEKEIDKIVSVLYRNNLLDDGEFAKMYVRDRNRFRPSGSYVLRMELKKLGVAEDKIKVALENQNEEELACLAIESKSKYRDGDPQKQSQFLARRGFSPNVIIKVLKGRENE